MTCLSVHLATGLSFGSSNSMDSIIQLWEDHNPRAAFNQIVIAVDKGEDLDSNSLTCLTGVRVIEKIVEGKGDELVLYINEKYALAYGFYFSLRVLDIESGKSWAFSEPVYHIADQKGLIYHDKKFIYYCKPVEDQYVIFEYDLLGHTSKPIGKIPKLLFRIHYDEENSLLQFVDKNRSILGTFDLNRKSKIQDNSLLDTRDCPEPIHLECVTGFDKLTISTENKSISIPYPRDEFLDSYLGQDLICDHNHPNSILIRSRWYPGLHIVLDLKNKTTHKIYLPDWLVPSENENWKLIDNKLYIWQERGEKAGLYRINLNTSPDLKEFTALLIDFSLARRRSGHSETKRA